MCEAVFIVLCVVLLLTCVGCVTLVSVCVLVQFSFPFYFLLSSFPGGCPCFASFCHLASTCLECLL